MLFSRSENSEYKPRRRKRPPISAHPLFVPALTLWAATLGGLMVIVLPSATINQATTAAALGVLGSLARYFFALLAAAAGAAIGYSIAGRLRDRLPVRSNSMMDHADAQIRPIDPASELGSESLDAPIEVELSEAEDVAEEPEVGNTADTEIEPGDDTLELGEEFEAEEQQQPAPEQRPDPEPQETDPLEGEWCAAAEDQRGPTSRLPLRRRRNRGKQVELVQALSEHRARQTAQNAGRLDLDEITQITAKNRTGGTATPPTAIDKLRAVPPQDLSLVQLVERLAVALHEHQDVARKRPNAEQSTERDAALAEALKALAVFTEKELAANDKIASPGTAVRAGVEDGTERELREALGKLQTMRGAA